MKKEKREGPSDPFNLGNLLGAAEDLLKVSVVLAILAAVSFIATAVFAILYFTK